MKKMTPTLREFFLIDESPSDDEGNPLRTADPFAPAPVHKAVGSTPTAPGMFRKDQTTSSPSPGAPKRPPEQMVKPLAKPSYPGTFVGQTWTTNDRMVGKNVAWKDRGTGDDRYGKVQSMQKVTMVWDGKDWVPQADFDMKAKQGRLAKK